MAPLEKLHGALGFADTAVAGQEDALAVDLHQNAVAGDPGGQSGFQVGDDGGDDGAGGILGEQYGDIVLFRHFQHFGMGLDAPGNEQGGELVGEQPVKDGTAVGGGQLAHIAHLHIAHNLQAHGFVVVEEARQLQARPGDVLHRNTDGGIVRGGVGNFQMKFVHQCFQRYGIGIDHGSTPKREDSCPHYSRGPQEYQPIFKKTKNFEKSACILRESLVSYSSACDRRSLLSKHPDGRCNKWRSVIFVARA